MKLTTINSLSGGKSSSYLAANYPADHNVFALVRTSDVRCKFKDESIRQEVEDRLQAPFIGTLEEDMIIYTMFDLEQFLGQKIEWVTGPTFDEVIQRGSKVYLPNVVTRFCTEEMKYKPIFDWCIENIQTLPVEMRIGYRVTEANRKKTMLDRCEFGVQYDKYVIGIHEKSGRKKYSRIAFRIPAFPMIDDRIFPDQVVNFWEGKPVRFQNRNNCIGCFHRSPHLLNYVSKKHPEKFDWFERQEQKIYNSKMAKWKKGFTYQKIREYDFSVDFFESSFSECDNGFCEV